MAAKCIGRARASQLIGREDQDFCYPDGSPMYKRVGKQLHRVGATDNCIVCGMPAFPGVVAFAHIHMRDLDWSPLKDPTRVFCLCWHHHHGCYDQGYISTKELLEAEMVWIENKRRPEPHPRDAELIWRVQSGKVTRICVWTNKREERLPTFEPNRPGPLDIRRSVAALKAHATR